MEIEKQIITDDLRLYAPIFKKGVIIKRILFTITENSRFYCWRPKNQNCGIFLSDSFVKSNPNFFKNTIKNNIISIKETEVKLPFSKKNSYNYKFYKNDGCFKLTKKQIY